MKRFLCFSLAIIMFLCSVPITTVQAADSITVTSEPSWSCSELTYRVMDTKTGYPNTMVFNKGSYWVSEFSWFELADGRIGYCIQPYKPGSTGNHVQNPAGWNELTQQRQAGIGLAFFVWCA